MPRLVNKNKFIVEMTVYDLVSNVFVMLFTENVNKATHPNGGGINKNVVVIFGRNRKQNICKVTLTFSSLPTYTSLLVLFDL